MAYQRCSSAMASCWAPVSSTSTRAFAIKRMVLSAPPEMRLRRVLIREPTERSAPVASRAWAMAEMGPSSGLARFFEITSPQKLVN